MIGHVLSFTCDILRNSETGTDPLGEPRTSRTSVASGVACRPVEKKRSAYSDAQARFVTIVVKMVLLPPDCPIEEGDVVTNVTGPAGDVDTQEYTVKDVVGRIGSGGYRHHISAELLAWGIE